MIAFEVDHGEFIKPAYGYRIEFDGRAVVISGDTRFNQNVIKYGSGADLLIHEVAAARPELMKEAYIRRIIGHHVTPREAGKIFALTKPKLAAFTHVVQLASDRVLAPTIDEILAETRLTYAGPLQMGEDLMCFEISDEIHIRYQRQS